MNEFRGLLASLAAIGLNGWMLVTVLGAGELRELQFDSQVMSQSIDCAVLLPDGYDASEAPLPLLLFLHGGGMNRDFLKQNQARIESLWKAKTLPPMVVVTPSCARGFYMDYKDGSKKWETFLIAEFLEHLREQYRVSQDRQGTLLFGVSMGGLGALRLSFKHPDQFAGVVALEPGIEPALRWSDVQARNRFFRSEELIESIFGQPVDDAFWQANNPASIANADPQRLREADLEIYLDAGDEDCLNLDEGTEFLHRVLWDHQIPHEYHLVRGADHVGRTLGPRIVEGLEFLSRVVNPPPADPSVEAFRRYLAPLKKRFGVAP